MKKLSVMLAAVLLTGVVSFAQIKIVCIGNSISHGKWGTGHFTGTSIGDSLTEMSYRFWFWEKLDSAGINATMVGHNTNYFDQWGTAITQKSRYNPTHTFVNNHEAYYGIKSEGFLVGGGWVHDEIFVLPSFDVRLNGYTPDVALIHIGTNDGDGAVDQNEANIKSIVAKMRAKNANLTVLLAKLTTGGIISTRMDRIASELATFNSIVYCVDQNTGWTPGSMTVDGVHPNAKGQKFMAQRWYDAYMKITKTDAVAPNVPTGLAVSNQKSTSIDLTWNASTDNTGVNAYNIYVNDVLTASTGTLKYTVTGLTSSTTYTFKITAADYKKNESAKTTGVNGTTTVGYKMTFIVNDGTTLLQNANVTFATVKTTTDVAGKTIYTDQTPGNNAYLIEKKGYKTLSGTVNLTKDTTITYSLLPDCSILFTVADGTTKIKDANVTLNGSMLVTNATGQATFTSFKPGTYAYSVTYKAYKTVSGNIIIADDTTVNIAILPDVQVSFVVTNGTNPLANAMINFNGQNKKTDGAGKASFTDMRPGTYTYMIKLTGYSDNTKSVTVADDTTFNIVLINPNSLNEAGSLAVYPNPAENIVNIDNAEGSAFELTDIGGIPVLKGIINASSYQLNTGSLAPGNYILSIIRGNEAKTITIQIVK